MAESKMRTQVHNIAAIDKFFNDVTLFVLMRFCGMYIKNTPLFVLFLRRSHYLFIIQDWR